jgi:glycosyltransferase involved in cell wall biosynthesis
LRENWDGAALFVDPGRPADLHAAIGALIANPEERARLATAAQRRARTFTLDRMAQAYSELYRSMMRNPAREAA